MAYTNTQLFIDGQWLDAGDRRSLPVVNPATGQEIGRVAHAGIGELDAAVAAAERGFIVWRDLGPFARGKIMRKAAEIFRERAGRTAELMTLEQGKPLAEARAEISAAADIVEWFAEEGTRVYGRSVPSRNRPDLRQMVVKDPVGPVAAFTPWNFPVNQIVRKLAPGLAAGCSMLFKGPEETPASAAELIRAFADAGLPPGVVGLVFGDPAEISNCLIPHPGIRKVTFTGSTAVGKQLASLAGAHMKRVTMELGGHAPVIICDDADLDLAVKASFFTKFRNAGQACNATSRFLVHRSIAKQFAEEFGERARGLKVGSGLEDGVQMGPLANSRRIKAMADLTNEAVSRGAKVLAGGERLGSVGNFWVPTVLVDVSRDARIFNEEPFGPIASIQPFDLLEDAIAEANRLPYGLAAYAFTRSLKNSDLLSRKVEAGMLWINTQAIPVAEMPFGGVKESGIGTEGGPEAIDAYVNVRSVAVMNA